MTGRYALIIASYEYRDADLRQLIAPAQDAEALSRVLSSPEIGDFEVQTLVNEPSHKVRQVVEAFFADRKRDDLLMLYFSGHGLKDEIGRLYFATVETRRKRLRSTALSANYVNEVMGDSRSRRQVLLLDCCYSGAFAEGMVAKSDEAIGTIERFRGRGRVVLTASDALQYAFEGDHVTGEGTRSVFTRTLVQGLETGEADLDQDGIISIDELYEYTYEHIREEMPQQQPEKWEFGLRGEIIIARNPSPIVVTEQLPPELLHAIESPLATVREAAVVELDRLLSGSHRGLALAARETLERMTKDDSRQVSSAAAESLARHALAYKGENRAAEDKRTDAEVEKLAFEGPIVQADSLVGDNEPIEEGQRSSEPEELKEEILAKPVRQQFRWPEENTKRDIEDVREGILKQQRRTSPPGSRISKQLISIGAVLGVIVIGYFLFALANGPDPDEPFPTSAHSGGAEGGQSGVGQTGNSDTPTPTLTDLIPQIGTITPTPTVTYAPSPVPSTGKIAFYSDRDGNFDIYLMDVDGNNLIRLTDDVGDDVWPAWSPDGTKIAFTSNRDGNDEIYSMDADGSNLTRLTNNEGGDHFPAWSPDGEKIAFTSDRDGNNNIYVMGADGNNLIRLTDNVGDDAWPAWSPDGKKIAFNSDQDGNDEIYVMGTDGKNLIRLTNNEAHDGQPKWSPDGKKIAFNSDRDGNYNIYVMGGDGNNLIQLTDAGNTEWDASWSPDGRRIAFVRYDQDGGFEIYVMDADGSNVIRLTNNTALDRLPTWSS